MPIHLERLPPKSLLARIYEPGKSFYQQDPYHVAFNVSFYSDKIIIKGLDKPLNKIQRLELNAEIEKAKIYGLPIYAERHGKIKRYA